MLQKNEKRKADGPDGITMEAFILSSNHLFAHLALFFIVCLKHYFLPNAFMSSLTLRDKNKNGDSSDVKIYRAIIAILNLICESLK